MAQLGERSISMFKIAKGFDDRTLTAALTPVGESGQKRNILKDPAFHHPLDGFQ